MAKKFFSVVLTLSVLSLLACPGPSDDELDAGSKDAAVTEDSAVAKDAAITEDSAVDADAAKPENAGPVTCSVFYDETSCSAYSQCHWQTDLQICYADGEPLCQYYWDSYSCTTDQDCVWDDFNSSCSEATSAGDAGDPSIRRSNSTKLQS